MADPYAQVINHELKYLADYINHLVDFSEEYNKAILRLCKNTDLDKVTKSKDVIEYENKIKASYDKAISFYKELKSIGKRYQSNQDIHSELVSFNDRLSLARFPIYESGTLKLITTKYKLVPKKNSVDEISTGAATEISDKISQDMTNNIEFPTIAGVEKKEPMTFEQASGGKVNPHYDKGGGYHRNCQVCVAVFEARMRGYDIEAKPLDENNEVMMELRRDPSLAFIDKNANSYPNMLENPFVQNYQTMINWFNNVIKPGERYGLICKIQPDRKKNELYDHIFIVYRTTSGELKFYDPQNNNFFSEFALDMIRFVSKPFEGASEYYSPKIFRLDNVDLNIEYLNKVSKKSK